MKGDMGLKGEKGNAGSLGPMGPRGEQGDTLIFSYITLLSNVLTRTNWTSW